MPISPLRPHARALPASVHDVSPLPDGRLAVLTSQGVFVLDGALQTVGASPGVDVRSNVVSPLGDGRFVVRDARLGDLFVGAAGAALEKVDLGEAYCTHAAATRHGFFASVTSGHVLVDRDGARRLVALAGRYQHGVVAFGDGAIAAGHDGFAILDADGEVRGGHEISLDGRPVPFSGGLAAPVHGAVVLLDGGTATARIPVEGKTAVLVAFGAGLLRGGEREVTCWEVRDGRAEVAWRFAREGMAPPTVLSNGLVVMSAWSTDAVWIRDAQGVISEVPLGGSLLFACAFGDGAALSVRGSAEVSWWRPGGEVARLGHDVGPSRLWEVPQGFVCAEDEVLYLWQTDVSGPEVAELAAGDMPFDTPLVVGGAMMTVRRGGRFALRGVTPQGRLVRVRPGTAFRAPVTRAEALAHIQSRIASKSGRGRAAEPDPAGPGFEEIGLAVGTSARCVMAGIRAGRFPLESPREVAGHEYIGAFMTSGELVVSDPCYLGKRPRPGVSLSLRLDGLPGRWHAFVRPGSGDDVGRTAELVVIHESGFGTLARDPLGFIGVDSGRAGVFDRAVSKWDSDAPLEEGIFAGQCAVVDSGHGDGGYGVFGGTINGKLAKVRIHFLGPTPPELDATMAVAPTTTARPYSPSERFKVGESVTHKKFGPGIVTRVEAGKMDVLFGEESRTLVCAR